MERLRESQRADYIHDLKPETRNHKESEAASQPPFLVSAFWFLV